MPLIDEGSLGMLGNEMSEVKIKAEVTKEIIKNVFSDDSRKIIQNTEFKRDELPHVFALELVDHFVIKRFCGKKHLRDNFRSAIDMMYQARVSIERKGRIELLDTLKNEQIGLNFGMQQQPQTVK